MSGMKKVILTLVIIIQIIILILLCIKNPLPEYMTEYIKLLRILVFTILFVFLIAVICYILEHKRYNRTETILDEELIEPKFNIDLNKNDILYLSTILNQQYPDKKEIILLIMQLINKKIIDLSIYFDGKDYQYIIEKRQTYIGKINDIEIDLINYLFENSNRVNLTDKVGKIYYDKNVIPNIVNKCYKFVKEKISIESNSEKLIYKVITVILGCLSLFLGICVLIFTFANKLSETYFNNYTIIGSYTLLAILCIGIAFVFTFILKRFNKTYQYNNDFYLWICKNLIFFNMFLMISYIFPSPIIIQFFIMIIYIFTTLTIMIKYNEHIILSENDIIIRNELIAVKKYLTNMNYLKDKEFGHIITYEECIMYGFLFNITIKINKEFDLLQKELFNIVKTEGHLYKELFKSNV